METSLPIQLLHGGASVRAETLQLDFGDHVLCFTTTSADLGLQLRGVYDYGHNRDDIQVMERGEVRGVPHRGGVRSLTPDPGLEAVAPGPRQRCLYDHLRGFLALGRSSGFTLELDADSIGAAADQLDREPEPRRGV